VQFYLSFVLNLSFFPFPHEIPNSTIIEIIGHEKLAPIAKIIYFSYIKFIIPILSQILLFRTFTKAQAAFKKLKKK